MGKVKTKTVKRSAKFLIEKYYGTLTTDFQLNKRFCDEVALIPSKTMRNKIAGFVTHLAKRLSRGKVTGLNLDLQLYNDNEEKIADEFNRMIEDAILNEMDSTTKIMIGQLLKEQLV